SPGHPLHALTSAPAALLPLGSIPLRVNLASAAALAGAAALLAAMLARWSAALGFAAGARHVLAAGVAVAAAFSYSLGFQGVRAEVYALHRLCLLAVVDQATRFGEGPPHARHLFLP